MNQKLWLVKKEKDPAQKLPFLSFATLSNLPDLPCVSSILLSISYLYNWITIIS